MPKDLINSVPFYKNAIFFHLFLFFFIVFFQQTHCHEANAQYIMPVELSQADRTQSNLQLGPVRLHPMFAISEIFDSNIFDLPNNEKSDLITMYSPGIDLFLPIRGLKSKFNVGYLANFLDYRKNPDQGHVNQYVDGSWETALPRGLSIRLHDRFEDTQTPPTYSLIYGSLVQRTRRRSNYFTTTVTLPNYFARFGSEISYSNNDHRYDGTYKGWDYNEQEISTRLTYKLLTKLDTLTEFNYGMRDYNSDTVSDSTLYEALAGLQWKETAKTSGIFKIGYRVRDYEEEGYNQYNGVIFSLESKTRLNTVTDFSVMLQKGQQEVIGIPEKSFYDISSVYLTFRRKLTKKIEGSLSNYYQFIDIPARENTPDVKYFTWGVRTSLEYHIQKWLFAELSYWFENRNAESDDPKYVGRDKNVITFTIGAAF